MNKFDSLNLIVSTACSSRIDSERFSTSENFVHSTHIAYLSLMNRSNQCHKNVWIYYYYYLHLSIYVLIKILELKFSNVFILINNEIHLYMMLTMNLLILFCVWIKVRRVKKSQFNAVQMMLKRCVIMKVIMQNFHLRDNIFSNSHNWSMKKINDMLKSVRDEKILLVEKLIQMMNLRLWLQMIEELMTRWLHQYIETSSSHQQCH